MGISKNLKILRNKYDLTQQDLADIAGVSNKAVSTWENGTKEPRMGAVQKMADHFGLKKSQLIEDEGLNLEQEKDKLPKLNDKDEKDIAKDLQEIINNLESSSGYAAYDGKDIDEMDQEDRELLIASLENSLRLAKRIAKQKFTPNKYKK